MIRLIHWNDADAAVRAESLRRAGYKVQYGAIDAADLRRLRGAPPTAVVIDLSRLPSHGRDVALALRRYKATRHVPLIFVAGDPEKVARLEQLLPDAVYTTWSRIRSSLKRAVAHPPSEPVVPSSALAGYSGTPLVKKLGIKANTVVALVGAPPGFEKTLGALPDGVRLLRQARGRRDLTLWFTKSRRDLERRIDKMAVVGSRGLWIIWPKQASGVVTDLSGNIVREIGLAAGLVDFKICAVDATWSGLRFVQRKSR